MVIGIVKVKMFDRILKTLGNVRHVSKNWKKFDFAGLVGFFGRWIFCKRQHYESKGELVVISIMGFVRVINGDSTLFFCNRILRKLLIPFRSCNPTLIGK
jgi:hypothetical protein